MSKSNMYANKRSSGVYLPKRGDLLGGFRIDEVSADQPGVYFITEAEARGNGFTLRLTAKRIVNRQPNLIAHEVGDRLEIVDANRRERPMDLTSLVIGRGINCYGEMNNGFLLAVDSTTLSRA